LPSLPEIKNLLLAAQKQLLELPLKLKNIEIVTGLLYILPNTGDLIKTLIISLKNKLTE
jgi:hypothetical protein